MTKLAVPPAGTTGYGDTDNDTPSNARFSDPYGITSDGTYVYVGIIVITSCVGLSKKDLLPFL